MIMQQEEQRNQGTQGAVDRDFVTYLLGSSQHGASTCCIVMDINAQPARVRIQSMKTGLQISGQPCWRAATGQVQDQDTGLRITTDALVTSGVNLCRVAIQLGAL